MAEFYAHERLARMTAQEMEMEPFVSKHFSAYLVGADGPDPMFFHAFWRYRSHGLNFQRLGIRIHSARCDQFLWALVQNARTGAQKAYVLGFFCHYALDQILHPYVRFQCRAGDFTMKGGHGYLEEAIDSTLYRMDTPDARGLEPPMERFGIFLIDAAEEEEIDALLCQAVRQAFKRKEIARGQFLKAFAHLRWAKRCLRHPTPFKKRVWRLVELALHLNGAITAHSSPLALPECDYMNLSHRTWFDEKAPGVPRQESVEELMNLAQKRATAYLSCVQRVWRGACNEKDLFALTRNRSYNSDVPDSASW